MSLTGLLEQRTPATRRARAFTGFPADTRPAAAPASRGLGTLLNSSPRARSVAQLHRQLNGRPVAQRVKAKLTKTEFLEVDDSLSAEEQARQVQRGKDIIREIKDRFGIKVDSAAGVKAILAHYYQGQKAPRDIKDAIVAAAWTLEELENLRTSLGYYAPILGKERGRGDNTDFSETKQTLTSVGKVEKALSRGNTGAPYAENTTLGETFKKKTVILTEALSTADKDFQGDASAQQRGTAAHEFSHALLAPSRMNVFVATFSDYWTDKYTRKASAASRVSTENPPAEAPITFYGALNAEEDLCEIAKFFFQEPSRLLTGQGKPKGTPGNPVPKRYAYFKDLVTSWKDTSDVHAERFRTLADGFLKLTAGAVEVNEIIRVNHELLKEYGLMSQSAQDDRTNKRLRERVSSHYVELVMA